MSTYTHLFEQYPPKREEYEVGMQIIHRTEGIGEVIDITPSHILCAFKYSPNYRARPEYIRIIQTKLGNKY